MRKLLLCLPLALALVACASSPAGKAAQVEQTFTAADTAWLAYIRMPDCATPEGDAAKPFCSKTDTIAKGAPVEAKAFADVEAYVTAANDPNTPTDKLSQLNMAAAAALQALVDITSALPHK